MKGISIIRSVRTYVIDRTSITTHNSKHWLNQQINSYLCFYKCFVDFKLSLENVTSFGKVIFRPSAVFHWKCIISVINSSPVLLLQNPVIIEWWLFLLLTWLQGVVVIRLEFLWRDGPDMCRSRHLVHYSCCRSCCNHSRHLFESITWHVQSCIQL